MSEEEDNSSKICLSNSNERVDYLFIGIRGLREYDFKTKRTIMILDD